MGSRAQRPGSGGRGGPERPVGRGGPRRTGAPERSRGPAGPSLAAHAEQLRDIVAPVVTAAGYDLEDLAISRAGRRSLVRIVVDGDDGVSLDAVAELSRGISTALDGADEGGSFGAEAYTLEVTSPGVDRPLTEPRHWRRNVGRLVAVGVGGEALVGRVTAADTPVGTGDLGVEMDVGGEPRLLRYAELGPGKVQIEFGRADSGKGDDDPEPGKEEA